MRLVTRAPLVLAASIMLIGLGCKSDKPQDKSQDKPQDSAKSAGGEVATQPGDSKPAKPAKKQRWTATFDGIELGPLGGPTIIAGPIGSAFSVKMFGGGNAILNLLFEPMKPGETGTFVPKSFSVQVPGGHSCGFVSVGKAAKGLTMKATLNESAGSKISGSVEGQMSCKHLSDKSEPAKTVKVKLTFEK